MTFYFFYPFSNISVRKQPKIKNYARERMGLDNKQSYKSINNFTFNHKQTETCQPLK